MPAFMRELAGGRGKSLKARNLERLSLVSVFHIKSIKRRFNTAELIGLACDISLWAIGEVKARKCDEARGGDP